MSFSFNAWRRLTSALDSSFSFLTSALSVHTLTTRAARDDSACVCVCVFVLQITGVSELVIVSVSVEVSE